MLRTRLSSRPVSSFEDSAWGAANGVRPKPGASASSFPLADPTPGETTKSHRTSPPATKDLRLVSPSVRGSEDKLVELDGVFEAGNWCDEVLVKGCTEAERKTTRIKDPSKSSVAVDFMVMMALPWRWH